MITVYTGPMFSGKTTKLIDFINESSKYCKIEEILLIKFTLDLRYNDNMVLVSHNKLESKELYTIYSDSVRGALETLSTDINTYKVVVIDEGQFFDDLTPACLKLSRAGISVCIGYLSLDDRQEVFGPNSDIVYNADKVKLLKSNCGFCGTNNSAKYTVANIQKTDKILIGGSDIYTPICDNCLCKRD